MRLINERSTGYLTVAFFDKTNAPAVPASVSYRIDCLTTGTAILAETALTPAASVEITLTPAQNAIVNAANASETRRVTIKATYAGAEADNREYDYQVRNLAYVS